MIPRLLTFLLPPVIGLGASYALAPIASGMLPSDQAVPEMVQAPETSPVAVWDLIDEIERTALNESEEADPQRLIRDLGVFQKPQEDAGELLSRVMSLGRFKTRTERDGTRHNLSVDLAFEFETHESALAAYDSAELMRLRDVALNAVIAAGQDDRVYRAGFDEDEVRRSVERVVRSDLPDVSAVHLVRIELRTGPVQTAMSR
jgi:hypothetical protein